MIPPGYEWKTNDGRLLDIRWMDSVHLAHSFNLLCRRNSLTIMNFVSDIPISAHGVLKNMVNELKARGCFTWGGAQTPQYGQIDIPKQRESLQKLCMFRALMDHRLFTAAEAYVRNEQCSDALFDAGKPEVIASYTAYRLEQR